MIDRRDLLVGLTAATAAASISSSKTLAAEKSDASMPVRFALNMSTIRGQKLSVPEQIDVAAKAGYDGIEPWIRDLQKYAEGGGSLPDLKKRISDAGMTVDLSLIHI